MVYCETGSEGLFGVVQGELSNVIGELPVSVTTSASDKLGKDDLLRLLAQLRAEQAQ